ncbi:hypothetical protein [Microbulbifer sp. S227A]|uniref:hypothetical protein n=1 Tax=Microbulbifer sp. S227A TaxID=3415131 RepID=UPI003C7D305B
MTPAIIRNRRAAAIAALCPLLWAGTALAESAITTPHQVDTDYEIASKDFGDGFVQMHSRRQGEGGNAHAVHGFDCANKTYAALYAGDVPPEAFPLEGLDFNLNPIEETSEVAPLAQHACRKHGYPLLEW